MALRFVDLDRYLAPVKAEPALGDDSMYWGKRYGGWLRWQQLLAHKRVVILAEAGSGKTEELKLQTRLQRARGQFSFFVRLEDLADVPFVDAIDHHLSSDLTRWLEGDQPGWFFLDAVDELKLVGKRWDPTLRAISKALNGALDRAHIIISSRPTDWDWRVDPSCLAERLRPAETADPGGPVDADAALMEPVRKRKPQSAKDKVDEPNFAISTFRLAALDQSQVERIAEANGVSPANAFLDAILAKNLESHAQTPLDVEVLIEYWKNHRSLASLAKMVEYVVDQKLGERTTNRADNNVLSRDDARLGAERVAATLALGKAVSVRFSWDDEHPTLRDNSPDIADILPDWTEAKRAALLRRGVFAPATFGRVRFHHRQTQDFLTACWFGRLMCDPRGVAALMRLAFPTTYGEATVVPSLVAPLAWLALSRHDVRDAMIERQPLALMQWGDPSSLDIDAKRKLLTRYAELNRLGKVPNDSISNRQLSLFADAGLADTLRAMWTASPTEDVRVQIIRLIGEARISRCLELCAEVAFDDRAVDYHRIIAVQALARCGADTELKRLASILRSTCGTLAEHICCGFALELFPRYLDASELTSIIENTQQAKELRSDTFANKLDEFNAACGNRSERLALLGGITRLCRQKPISQDYERVSARHKKLAEHLGPLVRDAINHLGPNEYPTMAVMRALTVMQWVSDVEGRDEEETLAQLVRSKVALNRALFWRSVFEDRVDKVARAKSHWQRLPWRSNRQLWVLGPNDWSWLLSDIRSARSATNRRTALAAAHMVFTGNQSLADRVEQLRNATRKDTALAAELEELLKPRQPDEWELKDAHQSRRWQCKAKIREIRTEREWKTFRDRLAAEPSVLCDPGRTATSKNVHALRFLSNWLVRPNDYLDRGTVLEWRKLERAFGRHVAEAYREGMRSLWRKVTPRRPTRTDGGGITMSWANHLSFHAVVMEARADPEWATALTAREVERAAGHLVLTEEGVTGELITLAKSRQREVMRILEPAFKEEWCQRNGGQQLLHHISRQPDELRELLSPLAFELLLDAPPEHDDVYELGIEILRATTLDEATAERTRDVARKRFHSDSRAGDEAGAVRALAMLFLSDPTDALRATRRWLGARKSKDSDLRAEQLFATLFGRDRALVTPHLAKLPVAIVEKIYLLCIDRVRPEHDAKRASGRPYTPDQRDRAESARGAVLGAILERPGRASYEALRRFGERRIWGEASYRFFELARERADKDSDLIEPWTAKETLDFGRKLVAPIKSGEDLMNATCGLLYAIQTGFEQEDANSRGVLALATNEDLVQNWFTEQLALRSNGQFHALREVRVRGARRADVIVASASGPVQLVVEIKHGGKGWTVRDLERAMTTQLGDQYLRPQNRRHGILLLTNHSRRYWKCPDTERRLTFDQLLERLNRLASAHTGSYRAVAVGLDVSSATAALAQPIAA